MGQIADAFKNAFRDYETDGVPSSGAHAPRKSAIRPIGALIEEQIDGISVGLNWINTGWTSGAAYEVNDAVYSNGGSYRVIQDHTSSAATRPGLGNNWQSVWSAIVEPVTINLPDSDVDLINARRLYEDRNWPLFPRAGYQAIPGHRPSPILEIIRNDLGWAFDDRGVLFETPPASIIHDHDPATGGYLGWRFEPNATNTFLHSNSFTNAWWDKARATISANTQTGLDGLMSCDRMLETSEHGAHAVLRTDTVSEGEQQVYSFVVRPIGRDASIRFDNTAASGGQSADFSLEGEGAVIRASGGLDYADIKRLSFGLYRVSAAFTPIVSGNLRVGIYSLLNGNPNFEGQTNRGLGIAHAQRETAARPSSVILTSDAPVQRLIPSVTRQLGEAREGTLYARFTLDRLPPAGSSVFGVWGDTNNRAHLAVSAGGTLSLGTVLNGQTSIVAGPIIEPGDEVRVAASYRNGAQHLAVNGQSYTASSPVMEDLIGADTRLTWGTRTGTTNPSSVSIVEAYYFAKALPAEQLVGMVVASGWGGDPALYTPTAQRVEVNSDLSRNITLAWNGPADAAPAAEYRIHGTSTWIGVPAQWRDIPASSRKTFFAQIDNLPPDTMFDWRPAQTGSAGVRKFKTLPATRTRDLRVAAVSDWQRPVDDANNPSSFFNQVNSNVAASDPDVVLIAGDLPSDDGVQSAEMTERWEAFLNAWTTRWVGSDGCQIPFCAVAGNHECMPGFGGAGVYGYMDIFFTTFYRPNTSNSPGTGYGWFTIGDELLCIGFETDHGAPILDQIDWVADILEMAPDYRHVLFFGHCGPVSHTITSWSNSAHGPIRNRLMPMLQDLPNAPFYICGHTHNIMATRKVNYVENPAGDVNAWSEDPGGIRVIGAGGWGMRDYLPYNTQDQASDPVLGDGSTLVEYLVASNQPPRNVTPISAPIDSPNDPATKHHWEIELQANQQVARCVALDRTVVLTLTESIT